MGEILRPYQKQGIYDIFNEWKKGTRSVLFQMPTGTGKTVLFSEIVKKGHDNNRKILIVVHRIELVEQIRNKLLSKNIDAGVIIAGEKADYTKIVQIASIQTLNRREYPEANLIIIDECHHAKADSYKRLWELYPGAKFLGVTATPVRLSGEGFDDLFDVLIPSMQIMEFIAQQYLAPVKYFVGAAPDLKGVKKRQGDYITQVLSRVMLNDNLMVNLLDSYRKHAPGKSTIVFAVDIEHSKQIVERFNQAGIQAVHIDSTTPKETRRHLLKAFKEKKINVISNVEIITEGFDFPGCEAVQLARPTKSLALYLQMAGRVMRIARGKSCGIILDNAGLWLEHGLPVLDREWTLTGVCREKPPEDKRRVMTRDRDGVLAKVDMDNPAEAEGLELIEVSDELERLLTFEGYLQDAVRNAHKVLRPFFRYKDYLQHYHIKLSKVELDYIKRRLNQINASAPEDKKFKLGFWNIQEKELLESNSR